MMTLQKRRWAAILLGTGFVLLLVSLASLDTLGDLNAPERFLLTEVTAYQPPPPPPPPPARPSNSRAGGSTGTTLALESRRIPTAMDLMQLDVKLLTAGTGEVNLGGLGQGIGVGSGDGVGDGTGGGFSLVTLSELDQLPMVVSAPIYPYPREATASGIAEFDLRFHIMIDEEGRAHPVAVVENPFPALNSDLMEWASKVRFSPPTRLGIPVRAEYYWPVKMRLRQ